MSVEADYVEIITRRRNGESLQDIANAVNRTKASVAGILTKAKKKGIVFPALLSGRRSADWNEVIKLLKNANGEVV